MNNEIVKNVILFFDISESASHTVTCIYMYYACLTFYSITPELCRIFFFNFVIELFAHIYSVFILFGIVAAASVVECNMHKHSPPLTFMKT